MAGIYDERILGAKQQAETARKLREGITTPDGKMVSGWYVAPSLTQHMATALKTYGAVNDEQKAQATYDELSKTKAQRTAELLRQLQHQSEVTLTPEGAQQMMQPFNPGTTEEAINNALNPQPQPMMTNSKEVQPSEQQRMSALLQGMSVNPEAFQGQLKAEEWNIARQDRQAALQAAADWKREQMAQNEALRREGWQQQQAMARLAASLRPAPQEKMAVVSDQNGNPVYMPQSQAAGQQQWNQKLAGQIDQRKTSALTAQQALDQAAALYAHPGRESGTGASSWMQHIPATDAKGFGSNLDTFKAKTFLDAVQAMKGLGALTEAEGARLVASVGSLDPSMKESEFAANLQRATRDMYDKAKAKGLDVTLPSFAAGGAQSGAVGNASVSNW